MAAHFKRVSLLKYALPSIVMMFTMSVYVVIDGYFISNFVNSTAFAAVNLIWPFLMIIASFGLMVGTGSSAIIANKMGEKNVNKANQYFSMFVYFCLILGVFLSIIAWFLVRPVAELLGAEDELLEIAVYYGSLSLISMPAYILQMAFLTFFNTAGRPNMGLFTAFVSGMTLFLLDLLLVMFLQMGINGVLIATVTSEFVAAIIPLLYFSRNNTKSLLHLVAPSLAFKNHNPSNLRLILKACINGSSEAIQEIAISLVVLFCMYQLNRFLGEPGIVAYGVIDYAWIIFNSFYLGYSIAVAPLMSYQQGAKNSKEMNSIFKNSATLILGASIIAFALSELLAVPFSGIFVGYDEELLNLSIHAFRIYSISFLFAGISIYASSLFTSLGNGIISALIAFLRTAVFETLALLILPEIFGSNGIWWAICLAEVLSAILAISFILSKGKRYKIL